MNYQVIETRVVPVTSTYTTMTGRQITENNLHGGKVGVAVKLGDGRMSWGFGDDSVAAEGDAVVNAMSI